MSYIPRGYLDNLDIRQYAQFLETNTPFGYHPETGDRLFIPTIDRYAGTYILGDPGMGKSGLLKNLIMHDIRENRAVIVIDPHADLITHCIAQLPPDKVAKAYLLDPEDVDYPFGVNVFTGFASDSAVALSSSIDKVMHVFDVLWPDILAQAHLPRHLRAACIVLMANPGSTLVDMHRFLVDAPYRKRLLQNVTDATVISFWNSFDEMSASQQRQQVEPLIGRLESLFIRRQKIRS